MKLLSDIRIGVLAYRKFFFDAWISLGFLLICRIIVNAVMPLNDTTEARYGEIARKMLETGNWVTLQHDYGVPFWAKPPLSTWLYALSMKLFGVNEFALRLPALLLSVAVLGLVWLLAKKHSGKVVALVSVLVLSGTFYFFLDAGVVMTEPALIFCTTLALVAFWRAVVDGSVLWSYLFFVGLGLGLLAKGPIALVLVGLPVFFWVLVHHQWRALWQKLPWISGSLLLSIIALPWYVLAERRTPGFLNYFIVGEHFHRFLTPGWTGDKYGMAHHAPRGMIWLYTFIGFCPWMLLALPWLVTRRKKIASFYRDNDGWISYLALCTFMPLFFFTFAGNIIYPYTFPSLPAFALLFAELWQRDNGSVPHGFWIHRWALIPGLCALLVTFIVLVNPNVTKTQKTVIQAWMRQDPAAQSTLLYWGKDLDFSAQFYSSGRAAAVPDIATLCRALAKNTEGYLVINAEELRQVPAALRAQLTLVDTLSVRYQQVFLCRIPRVVQGCH